MSGPAPLRRPSPDGAQIRSRLRAAAGPGQAGPRVRTRHPRADAGDPRKEWPERRRRLARAVTAAGDFLARLGLAAALVCLGVVVLVSAATTVWLMTSSKDGNLTQSMSVFTVMSPDSWAVLAAGLAGGVVVAWACWAAWRHGRILDGPVASRALVAAALVAQLSVILALQTRDAHWGDSWMVGGMVDRAVEAGSVQAIFSGPWRTLFYEPRLYFACYPFQAAYFWLFYGLRLAFGDLSYLVFQVISALGTCLAVASLLDLVRTLTPSAGARRVTWVLVALCLPMYWLSTFLYCNALGFGFAAAFLALQARSMRAFCAGGLDAAAGTDAESGGAGAGAGASAADGVARAVRPAGPAGVLGRLGRRVVGPAGARPLAWCLASLVPLALALCVKATFVLFVIGAGLAWAVLALCRRDARCLVAFALVAVVARALSGLPFEALRAASGGYQFGEPLTTLNHLELGLRMGQGEFYVSVDGESPTFAPGGWSNHANALWEASGENAAVQDAAAAQLLAGHVVTFWENPSYTWWFFSVKLVSEWADPTYQALYYLSENLGADGSKAANPADLTTTTGVACTVLTFMLDGYQTITFVAALGYVVRARRDWRERRCDAVGEGRAAEAGGESAAAAGEGRAAVAAAAGEGVAAGGTPAHALRPVRRDPVTLLLAATFFVGFGCYLLWEAKSVYVLPFATILLPLSGAGIDRALACLQARVRRLGDRLRG